MKFEIQTKGHYDFINVTSKVEEVVLKSGVIDGLVTVFVKATTVGLTTMEWENGLIADLKNLWEKIAPEQGEYAHHQRWGDHNGAAHLKSALMGTSVVLPVEKGKLVLGTWQQIVLIDFDERPRKREVVVKILPSHQNSKGSKS